MRLRDFALLSVIGALGLGACAPAAPAATATPAPTALPALPGWRLVWQDEFDGAAIDRTNWTYDLGGGGWGNGEMQTYTDAPDNARVEAGRLIIAAQKTVNASGGAAFTSARLKTQGLRAFQYGRIEARLKVPAGKGLWPAFWMLGENFPVVGWPDCGEIDIMEYVGREPATSSPTPSNGTPIRSAGFSTANATAPTPAPRWAGARGPLTSRSLSS